MTKKRTQRPLLDIDIRFLDEWLENDLRTAGVLPTNEESTIISSPNPQLQHMKSMSPLPITPVVRAVASLYMPQYSSGPMITTVHQALTAKSNDNYPMPAGKIGHVDTRDLKRQRNTDAARRSRLRKAQKMESLEKRVVELENDNEQLVMQIAILEKERDAASDRVSRTRDKVKVLEEQLAETHQALINSYKPQMST